MPKTEAEAVADTKARARDRISAIVGPRRTPYEHEVDLWFDGWTQGVDHALAMLKVEPAKESVATH